MRRDRDRGERSDEALLLARPAARVVGVMGMIEMSGRRKDKCGQVVWRMATVDYGTAQARRPPTNKGRLGCVVPSRPAVQDARWSTQRRRWVGSSSTALYPTTAKCSQRHRMHR